MLISTNVPIYVNRKVCLTLRNRTNCWQVVLGFTDREIFTTGSSLQQSGISSLALTFPSVAYFIKMIF